MQGTCATTLILRHEVCFDGAYLFVSVLAVHAIVSVLCVAIGWLLLSDFTQHVARGKLFINMMLATVCSGVLIVTWRLSGDGWDRSMGFSTAVNMLFVFLGLVMVDMTQKAFPLSSIRGSFVTCAAAVTGLWVTFTFGLNPKSESSGTQLLALVAGPAFLTIIGFTTTVTSHHASLVSVILGVLTMIIASHALENRFWKISHLLPSAPLLVFTISFVTVVSIVALVRRSWAYTKAHSCSNGAAYGTFQWQHV